MNITKPKLVGVVKPPCPVCGKPSYSRGGVHPQCSMRQADALSRAAQRSAPPACPLPGDESR
jgi:hypothetical protein